VVTDIADTVAVVVAGGQTVPVHLQLGGRGGHGHPRDVDGIHDLDALSRSCLRGSRHCDVHQARPGHTEAGKIDRRFEEAAARHRRDHDAAHNHIDAVG